MSANYLNFMVTDSVRKAQEQYVGRSPTVEATSERDALTDEEMSFIQARDSFYIATISQNGWPYIQHRGGHTGFLRVLNSHALAFADYRGNRQMLSTGNIAANDRVALFLIDYPQRTRLKILGHARIEDARQHRDLIRQLSDPDVERVVERLFFVEVVSFDWNCPQYITPRYTLLEMEELIAPLKTRIAELETKLTHEK